MAHLPFETMDNLFDFNSVFKKETLTCQLIVKFYDRPIRVAKIAMIGLSVQKSWSCLMLSLENLNG